ncbi:MAG TPA: WecB/TagA/CpsF family glycosyltransferase, partial [Bacteroidota bacterium]|nr:WecB/TagA/CpsF family glycosyltransferase [Bacteroidota bacterium]
MPTGLNILGVRIDPVSMQDVIEWVRDAIDTRASDLYILVVNVAKLINAREDSTLRQTIDEADLVGVDGMPLVWYSKLLPQSLPEKVSGVDIMMTMFREGNHRGWSFFFLGASSRVIDVVSRKFCAEFPHAPLKGHRDGYFSEMEESAIVERIRLSGANILLIGFGSPRKEMFVRRWKGQLGVNVVHGVGGSFDVYG